MPAKYRIGKHIYLRPLEDGDMPAMYEGMNDPEVRQHLESAQPLSFSAERKWFEDLQKRTDTLLLAIVMSADNKHVGNVALHNIKYVDRTATTGTVIWDKGSWGKGYATEAKLLLLEIAFLQLGLHSVMSRVNSSNGASLRYAKKCGYQEVARIPDWIFRDGERHDEVLLIVTRERWEMRWEEYKKSLPTT